MEPSPIQPREKRPGLKICHVNIRSLNSSFHDFCLFIQQNNYTFVDITETWLSEDCSDSLYAIPNYTLVRKDRNYSRGGGVCWYIHNKYAYKVVVIEHPCSPRLEQLWIIVSIKNESYGLGVVYIPPGQDLSLLEDLDASLTQINSAVDKVVMVGDLNIDLLKTTKHSTGLLNIMEIYNLDQIVDEETRITSHSRTLIDIICLSRNIEWSNYQSVDLLNMTDHFLIECELLITFKPSRPKVVEFRDFSNFNSEYFAMDAELINWNHILELDNIDDKIDYFNSAVLSLFDFHAPLKKATVNKPRHPYITYPIVLLIKEKEKARSKYLKTKSPASFDYYKNLKNYCTTAINNEKKAYIQFHVNKNKNNPKALWNNLRKVNIHNRTEIDIPEDRFEVNQLNQYFTNFGSAGSVDQNLLQYYKNNVKDGIDCPLHFRETTSDEIRKIVHQLKSNACGIDRINVKLLKLVLPHCDEVITHIINFSMLSSTVPNVWKKSVVLPLPKKSSPEQLPDLRPISILPTMSKILEKVISSQISTHVNEHILPCTQSGFRAGHSTNTALLKITNDITKAIDQSRVTFAVLLDFSKAFDTIDHELLIAKLCYYGMSSQVIQWFQNYLSHRTQCVKLHQQYSQEMFISKGVPQGSILGPVLFTIYTGNLHDVLGDTCNVHQYADDTQLYQSCSIGEVDETIANLNKTLVLVQKWSKRNGLVLNPKKTSAVCFGTKLLCARALESQHVDLELDSTIVKFKNIEKSLGVYLDSQLNFEHHVHKLLGVAYAKFKSIYKFKNLLSCDVKWNLCNSLILSNFNYCSSVYYFFLTGSLAHKVQKMQNVCLRFSFNIAYRDHLTVHYDRLSILKTGQLFTLQYLQLIFNVVKNSTPKYLEQLLTKRCDIRSINLRFSYLYSTPLHSCAKFENCFEYRATSLYNSHYDIFASSATLLSFKRKMKSRLLNPL